MWKVKGNMYKILYFIILVYVYLKESVLKTDLKTISHCTGKKAFSLPVPTVYSKIQQLPL